MHLLNILRVLFAPNQIVDLLKLLILRLETFMLLRLNHLVVSVRFARGLDNLASWRGISLLLLLLR